MTQNLDAEKNMEEVTPGNESVENQNNIPAEKTQEAQDEIQSEASNEKHFDTKDEILEVLKNLIAQSEVPHRSEVEALKQAYYRLRSKDIEEQKAAFLEAGNDESEFKPSVDPQEDVLKTFLAKIKEKRAAQVAAEDRLREENYEKKLKLIDHLKELTESTEDFNKLYKDFKDIQQEWNDIKLVPASKEKELWKSYQYYSEIFYDLIKINNEFRDYDFKKNQELKEAIIEAAEKLIEEEDHVSAFHQLQNFHDQWREIGPVAKELREEIWGRFKAASTEINKRYQSHFESLKGKEEENLVKKTAIIDKLKAMDYSAIDSMKAWDEASKGVIELQAEWKTIGFVPRKFNNQIFEEFRKLCDDFFEKKSSFFKKAKDSMDENLEKKRALAKRANELKDSTDWKKTTDEMVTIQKEWKKIGPVSRKYSDAIWKEFVTACDYFFEQKKKNSSSQRIEEEANLKAKQEIVAQINAIDTSVDVSDAISQVRELVEKWNAIGFVPFKEKDRAYKEFHAAVDAQYDRLKVDKAERRMDAFKSNLDDMSKAGGGDAKRKLLRERDRLLHTYNKLKTDLQTYENNMNFLSISSKGASGLLKDVNVKIKSLKEEMELIEKKVETLDANLDELEAK